MTSLALKDSRDRRGRQKEAVKTPTGALSFPKSGGLGQHPKWLLPLLESGEYGPGRN